MILIGRCDSFSKPDCILDCGGGGLQFFYNGHKHTYFRTCPVRFGRCATGRNADGSIQGTVYLTAGNAGRAPTLQGL